MEQRRERLIQGTGFFESIVDRFSNLQSASLRNAHGGVRAIIGNDDHPIGLASLLVQCIESGAQNILFVVCRNEHSDRDRSIKYAPRGIHDDPGASGFESPFSERLDVLMSRISSPTKIATTINAMITLAITAKEEVPARNT